MRLAIAAVLLAVIGVQLAAGEAFFRHPDDAYPQLGLAWRPLPGAGICERIWPHPLLPGVIAFSGDKGLRLTRDGGMTWLAPSGLPAGAVRCLAWHPGLIDAAVAVAGPEQQLWRTTDGGRTFAVLGAAKDLPSAAGVWFVPRDSMTRLLVAAHGTAANGLSISTDDGATWRQALGEYQVHQVFTDAIGSQSLAVLASRPEEPQVRTLLYLPSPNEKPIESLRDGAIADASVPVHHGGRALASPRDGLLRLEDREHGFIEAKAVATGQELPNGLSALAYCWGAHVDRQLLFTFDPFGLGVTYSADNTTWTAVNQGLPIGELVKEGSQFRANANGSRFYAQINNRAYIGTPADLRLDGSRVEVDPPVANVLAEHYATAIADLASGLAAFNAAADPLAAARRLRGTLDAVDASVKPNAVTLRVRLAEGEKPQRVTLDLSRFGQSSQEPLHDDGAHGDGAAGDGTWGTDVAIRPGRLVADKNDWRRSPGVLGLGVTAHWADGSRSGVVAPLLVWSLVESLDLFRERKAATELAKVVSAEGMTREVVVEGDATIVTLKAAGGPWKVTLRLDFYWRSCLDVASYAGMALDWRGGPMAVQLVDRPLYDEPHQGEVVAVAPGPLLGAADRNGWARARIALTSLIPEDSQFDRNRVVAVVISGDAKPGETFAIRAPRLLSAADWSGP